MYGAQIMPLSLLRMVAWILTPDPQSCDLMALEEAGKKGFKRRNRGRPPQTARSAKISCHGESSETAKQFRLIRRFAVFTVFAISRFAVLVTKQFHMKIYFAAVNSARTANSAKMARLGPFSPFRRGETHSRRFRRFRRFAASPSISPFEPHFPASS